MDMRAARKAYRRAVKASRELGIEPALSFRAYARWMCAGGIATTGKLAKICASQAAGRT